MSDRIHMETERVQEMAAVMRREAEQMDDAFQMLSRRVNNLPWESPNRQRFIQRFRALASGVSRNVMDLDELAMLANREVDQWIEAAAHFGGAGGYGGTSGGKQNESKKSMQDLYNLIAKFPSSHPYQIYKTGPNTYAVLIRGLDLSNPWALNNLGSAFLSNMGLPSDYEREILENIRKTITEKGATVYLVGHSLGGITAQNIADSAEFRDKYKLGGVITFGSGETAMPSESDKGYQMYRAGNDIVPVLTFASVFGRLFGRTSGITAVDTGSSTYNPIGSHLSYGASDQLAHIDSPFSINNFSEVHTPDGTPEWTPGPKTSATLAFSQFCSGGLLQYGGWVNLGSEVGKGLLLGAGNFAVDSFSKNLSPDDYQHIDLYRDRFNDWAVHLPLPAQVVTVPEPIMEYATKTAGELVSAAGKSAVSAVQRTSADLMRMAGQINDSLVPDVY